MYGMVKDLYPICRSITGNGVRQTLRRIGEHVPLVTHEVASGTAVYDWTVPKEWNIRDAYIIDPSGRKLCDFKQNNLHVLNYSMPIHRKMSLAELKPHLFSIPDHPDWIPYRTSYYKETWGFCLSHKQLLELVEGEYEVVVDSSLEPGALTYGECLIKGESTDEVLLSCHTCHPSLCNDNLSGIALTTYIGKWLQQQGSLRYSYRLLFIPGTIGSITWLSRNEQAAKRIKHGLVVTCVGDGGPFSYKKSRRGEAEIDVASQHVLGHRNEPFNLIEWYPYGYDERQYCSPGFNLAVGSLSRSSHGQYDEYHTSADDLQLVQPEYLAQALQVYLDVIDVLEHNRVYVNLQPKCEPQLGKRGLYRAIGATHDGKSKEMALLWVLNLADGEHSLLAMAERSGIEFKAIKEAALALRDAGLLSGI